MIGVFIVPTGVGAAIGGHAGDATPAAKLIASCCDKLIVHPNVVNASDINEMTENMLYVDGYLLDEFLDGNTKLKERKCNKTLLVANHPLNNVTVNAVNAAKVTLGADIEIMELNTPLTMVASAITPHEQQGGDITGVDELVDQVRNVSFDTLAVHTPINVHNDVALNYFRNGGINPWGGVEAKASRAISRLLYKPVAHAPLETLTPEKELYHFKEVVDPRIAPEMLSSAYLHCVLRGLHRAPLPSSTGISYEDVDFMISPTCSDGRPHKACNKFNIPIIYVKENTVEISTRVDPNGIYVETYIEAAGIIMSMQAGVTPTSVRTKIT